MEPDLIRALPVYLLVRGFINKNSCRLKSFICKCWWGRDVNPPVISVPHHHPLLHIPWGDCETWVWGGELYFNSDAGSWQRERAGFYLFQWMAGCSPFGNFFPFRSLIPTQDDDLVVKPFPSHLGNKTEMGHEERDTETVGEMMLEWRTLSIPLPRLCAWRRPSSCARPPWTTYPSASPTPVSKSRDIIVVKQKFKFSPHQYYYWYYYLYYYN